MEGDLQRPRTLPTIAFAQPLSPVCDPMRFPAKFQLRRILRRLPTPFPAFPQENAIVRESYSGSYATHVLSGTKRQEVAKPSASRRF